MKTEHRPKVLLVDDEPENLVALEAILDGADRELHRALSAEEALRLMDANDYAAVLLDVEMPEMDGFEMAEVARASERLRHVPILFVNDLSRERHHLERGYAVGAADYLFKPLDPMMVSSKVDVFLELHRHKVRIVEQARRLKRLSEELKRSNRDLQDFASVAAHDLREPMRTVLNFLQLVRRELGDELPPRVEKFMAYVDDSAERMTSLIDGLLEWSRVGSRGKAFAVVSTTVVMDDVLRGLGRLLRESGTRIDVGPLPDVVGDELQIGQLLQNLMENAIKFRTQDDPRVRIDADRDGTMWEFRIQDNGIGVPEDARERVFEIFKRLHTREEYEGTGVGLAVCKRIVQRHGGRIWLGSTPGGGTTVHFTLPGVTEGPVESGGP